MLRLFDREANFEKAAVEQIAPTGAAADGDNSGVLLKAAVCAPNSVKKSRCVRSNDQYKIVARVHTVELKPSIFADLHVHKIVFGIRKGNKFGLQISLLLEISMYRTTNEGIEVRASYSAFIGLNYRQRGPRIGGRPEHP